MGKCQHVNKNGTKCGNKILPNSKYCYLKSHYPDTDQYLDIVDKLYQDYLARTIDHQLFTIKDVIGDGACLYRCLTIHLLKNLDQLVKIKPDIYTEIVKTLNEFFQLQMEDSAIQIENWSTEQYHEKISDIIDCKLLETNYYLVNKIAKYVQILLKKWLVQNQDYQIDELGGISIRDLVEGCHGITIDQYDFLYNIFAGDVDYLLLKMDDEDSPTDVSSSELDSIAAVEEVEIPTKTKGKEKKKEKYKKINIPDRWGSSSEIYAFSGLFHAVINVYVIKRFEKKNCSIVVGKKVLKTSRLELYQRVELRTDAPKFTQELDVLLIERRGIPHYQYLDRKPLEVVDEQQSE